MRYFKRVITLICLMILFISFMNKKYFLYFLSDSPKEHSLQKLFTKQVCTPALQITPYLLSLFYNYKQLIDLENLSACIIAMDIYDKPMFKQLFPSEAFNSFYQQNCQNLNVDTIRIDSSYESIFLYKTKDQKKFCSTPQICFDIVLIKENLMVLQEKENQLQILQQVKPFVYKKAEQSIYPTLLDPSFQWEKFQNNIEMGLAPGGMGNHLFQYWTAKVHALKYNKTLYCQPPNPTDTTNIMDIFNFEEQEMPPDAVVYSHQSPLIKAFYKDKTTGPNQALEDKFDYVFIKGYLQSYKNFKGYENYIRDYTRFKKPLSQKNKKISDKMKKQEAVALHIRRGDYLYNNYYLLSPAYYYRAIQYMNNHVKNPHYYIFSNDIQWAKENLSIKEPHTFVDWNKKDYEDLQLMTYCKHFIIANSTFSWWGAFLSKNPNKIVIAPDKWIPWAPSWEEELILPNWIRQKNE